MLAVPAGVLCSGITPVGPLSLGLLWMGGAAAWAVGLYFRRARPGRLSLGAGARIGLVTGAFRQLAHAQRCNGIALWVTRFVMHQGGQMDSRPGAAEVESSQQLSRQLVAQMGLTAAQAAQSTQASRAWMLSAEGRAGIALVDIFGRHGRSF